MTPPRRVLFVPFVLFVLFLPSSPLSAQQHPNHERGFDPEKAYQLGDLDSVNLLNGNLVLTVPIGASYPVSPALSYALTLTYNAKAWDHEEIGLGGTIRSRAIPSRLSNAGMGWSLSLGRLLDPTDPANDYETWQWVYLGADGADHVFYADVHAPGTPTIDPCTTTCYTRDGSYLRMRRVSASERVIEFPNGARHTFTTGPAIPGVPTWRLGRIDDTFGSPGEPADLTLGYLPDGSWQLHDRHGRDHFVYFEPDPAQAGRLRIREVNLASFGGQRAIYPFSYVAGSSFTSLAPACSSTDPNWATVRTSQLAAVTLPDGSRFQMAYLGSTGTIEDGWDCLARGALSRLTLPTGGQIRWKYEARTLPVLGCSFRSWHRRAAAVRERTLTDRDGAPLGLWTYTTALSTPPPAPAFQCENQSTPFVPPSEELQVTVTTPLQDKSVHFFSVYPGAEIPISTPFRSSEYGLPFTRMPAQTDSTGSRFRSRDLYECDNAGANCTLLRASFVRFEDDGDPSCGVNFNGDCFNRNRRQVSEREEFWDDWYDVTVNNQVTRFARWADVDRSNFDGLGHYRRIATNGDFPNGGNVQVTTTEWNPQRGTYPGNFTLPPVGQPWLLETFTEQVVEEGGDLARTQVCFDSSGFPTRRRTWLGTSTPGPRDLLTVTTRNAVGEPVREELYGGDLQTLNTSTDLCALPLPSAGPRYRTDTTFDVGVVKTVTPLSGSGAGVGWSSVDRTIDASTGLAATERDPSGVETTYTYDPFGRLTRATPQAGADGQTWMTFTPAVPGGPRAKVRHETRDNKGNAVLTFEEAEVDGFGRVVEERRGLPANVTATRLTAYDAAGHLERRSEWQSGVPTRFTVWRFFDAVDRPGRMVLPDGKRVVFWYSGVSGRTSGIFAATTRDPVTGVITETGNNHGEFYDRQGRLVRAREPVPGSNNLQPWDTRYFYDVLGNVRQVNQGEQTRLFGFDRRGFLKSETHPELGPGAITYDDFDPRGNPRKFERGGYRLWTDFDTIGRPTKTFETRADGSEKTWKTWAYGVGRTAADRSAAKVTTETRFNWVVPPWGGAELGIPVSETNTYGGRGGRISRRDTLIQANDKRWTQSFTWDELGNLAAQVYPRCQNPNCTPTEAPPRTVSYGYQRGLLTSVAGFGSLTHHPNGLVHQVSHGNGVADTHTLDPFAMARPGSIEARLGGSVLWSSGVYSYDGAGSVVKMGADWFVYDSLFRLVSSRVADGGTEKKQAFSLDRYGNLLATTTTVGPGSPVTSTSPIVASTNRLSGAGYDAAGNVIAWGGQSYGFDPFNAMRYAPGRLYLYGPGEERIWEFAYTDPNNVATFLETLSLRGLDGKVLREWVNVGGDEPGRWTASRDFVYREGMLLAAADPYTSAATHFTLDHLGSPRLATGPTGAVVSQHTYFAYGTEATAFQNFEAMKFTGHERDFFHPGATDDLDYMHARFYSPHLSRFLSLDPVGGDPRRPQSWNRYAYVQGNPLKYVDPTGEAIHDAVMRFGAIYLRNLAEAHPFVVRIEQMKSVMGDKPQPQWLRQVRDHVQARFEQQAAAGNHVAALVDWIGLSFLLPQKGEDLSLSVVLGGRGASLSRNTLRTLNRQLASQQQLGEIGRTIAGAGANKTLDDAPRLVAQYGGELSDWAKMRSSGYTDDSGFSFATHWYENAALGLRVEYKVKLGGTYKLP